MGGLAQWEEQYKQSQVESSNIKKPSGLALKRQLNAVKKAEFPWMYEVTKYASQQPFIHLQRAFGDWLKDLKSDKPPALRKARPRFKKKGQCRDSFYVGGDQVKVIDRRVKVPNLGWITMAEPLKYGGHINSMTISRQADKWYVSFSLDVELCRLPNATSPGKNQAQCGVDLGIKSLATLSSGDIQHWPAPKPLAQSLRKLKRMQRRLAKKTKGSGGYQRLKMKIARLHKRIADIRSNTLHQLTRYLTDQFSDIVIEDLNVRGMLQNRRLSRHIAEVGLFEFRRQLTYKLAWSGGNLIIANRWFASSKLCSGCGETNSGLSLSDRVFQCPSCGHCLDRDLNASINLERYPYRSFTGNQRCGT